ncbi:cache domain-containing sensor histidine kinase [Marinicrinis sediminis]|uniref:histidine kinase n=1 Tax=Marinicrinis sediminis TaxID=1652465 RepID=A0ABW5RB85_9BACL
MKSIKAPLHQSRTKASQWSITRVMQVSFLALVIVPIFLTGMLSYQSYKSILVEQSIEQSLQTLQQVSIGIDREASQIMNTAESIYQDVQLLQAAGKVAQMPNAEAASGVEQQRVREMIQNYYHYTDDMISVIFFYQGGGAFSSNADTRYSEKLLRTSIMYNKALAQKDQVLFFGLRSNDMPGVGGKYLNTAAVALPPSAQEQTGVELIYFIYRDTLFHHLFDTDSDEHGTFILVDQEYRVIAANREAYIQSWWDQPTYLYRTMLSGSGEYQETIEDGKSFITFHTAPESGFKVIHMIPYAVLMAPLQKVFQLTVVIIGTVMVLFLLVSWYLARMMTRPVKDLVKEMVKMRRGHLQSDYEPSGPTEVYILGARFKLMLSEIDQLMKDKEVQERAKAMAELRALQSQINPHFLLNTLNTIKLMAVIGKVPNIRDMTDAFIRLLSSTFNRGGSLHRVKDEVDYLEKYFYIMSFRYGNYDLIWEIDEQLKETYMLKLLIQPIVENAIVHGLQYQEGSGVLRIQAKREQQTMVFVIEDNGVGISQEETRELLVNKETENFSGIGVHNVHQRIRLHYGEPFGLEIQSMEGKGTRVTINLPVLEENKWDGEEL